MVLESNINKISNILEKNIKRQNLEIAIFYIKIIILYLLILPNESIISFIK